MVRRISRGLRVLCYLIRGFFYERCNKNKKLDYFACMFLYIKNTGGEMGYTKLFSEIVLSTVWQQPAYVKVVWVTMLAMKDRWHKVNASLPGLAKASGVTLEECEKAIEYFKKPDPYSRTKDNEGIRIVDADGGWLILNGEKYRNMMSLDERREYNRIKQREYYKNKPKTSKKSVQPSTNLTKFSSICTHTEADTDSETDTNERRGGVASPLSPLSLFWNEFGGDLPKVQSMSRSRIKKEALRLKELGEQKLKEAILCASRSDFCCGKNERGWRASYDWFIANDQNALKILEGRYDTKKQKTWQEKFDEEMKNANGSI